MVIVIDGYRRFAEDPAENLLQFLYLQAFKDRASILKIWFDGMYVKFSYNPGGLIKLNGPKSPEFFELIPAPIKHKEGIEKALRKYYSLENLEDLERASYLRNISFSGVRIRSGLSKEDLSYIIRMYS